MAIASGPSEFIVNSQLDDNYFAPDIVALEDANFVVVYQGDGTISPAYDGIYGQIFSNSGIAIGDELVLDDPDNSTSMKQDPRLAALPDGTFVVAAQMGNTFTRLGHFDNDGSQLSFPNNNSIGSNGWDAFVSTQVSSTPTVSVLANGEVVLGTTRGRGDFSQDQDIYQAVFRDLRDSASFTDQPDKTYLGNGTLNMQQIIPDTSSPVELNQREMQVAGLSGGGFVSVWVEREVPAFQQRDNAPSYIRAKLFETDANPSFNFGVADGESFAISGTEEYFRFVPQVAGLPDGGFVVVWQSTGDPADPSTGIRFRLFDADGTPRGNEQNANSVTDSYQSDPDVAVFDDGRFVIVWEAPDNSFSGIWSREFMADGTPVAIEQQVNTDGSWSQTNPAVTVLGNESYAVAWQDDRGSSETTVVEARVVEAATAGALEPDNVLQGTVGNDFIFADGFEVAYALPEANQVFRLYQATFNRLPDEGGHKGWTQELLTGARSLSEVREAFVGSAEFTNKYNGLDDADFVKQMYINVLDRDFDQGEVSQAEIDGWVNLITDSFTRADVVNGFAESLQLINNTLQAANALAVNSDPASWSDDVYRLYKATLDRAPDFAGFEGWSESLSGGRPLTEVIAGFTNSQEFTNTYGTLTDPADFVKLLYNNVLDRDFDAGEVTQVEIEGWTSQLSETFTRSDIVQGFSQSLEFRNKTAQELKDWIRSQGLDDQINGGAGTNLLAGGSMSDQFVFNQADAGTNTVVDLETWDYVSFDGFGFTNEADARAHMQQSGNAVIFADQGTEITFEQFQLNDLTDDMILI